MRIKEVPNNHWNRKMFRPIARDTSGETFEAPSGEKILFCYSNVQTGRETFVGASSFRLADKSSPEDGKIFDNNYCHMITYIFVKGYDQRCGYGKALLKKMLTIMLMHIRRPVRVESASGAVVFFRKNGFEEVGEPIDCVCSGSPLFSRLIRMEWLQKCGT